LPRARRLEKRPGLLLAGGGVILAVLVVIGGYIWIANPFHKVRTDLVLHTVHYETLNRTLLERGTLESANNSDIYCRVKALAKNSTVSTTIKWVIDDGSLVKKGDLLVDLDDSGLQEQLKAEKITLDKDEADKIQAEEAYKIQVAQNESDIKAAEVALELAKIDLQKYLEGDFPAKLKDYQGQVFLAESDMEEQRDRVAWAQRMVKKGYYTVSQAQAEQSKLDGFEQTLRLKRENLRVLTDPVFGEKKRTETDLRSKVVQAERELNRIKGTALAKEVQARTDRDTKKSLYLQELSHYKDIEEEIHKCKIYAPQDGMVVYYIPEQARYGGGSQQSIVAQGEPVREGQKLMQIPDLTHMQVNTKVHEALVSHVHKGEPSMIRVDSFPDQQLHGQVETVSTVSSQLDFWSSDVKVYTTKVGIEESLEGLKPGMSAEVTISIGDPLQHVLTVPVEAIIGSAELGKKRDVFVVTPHGPEKRSVVIGSSNETMVEVTDGLKEGDQVVLNPRALGEQAKTRQPGSGGKAGGNDSASPGEKKGERGKKPGRTPGAGGPGGPGTFDRGGPPDRSGPGSRENDTTPPGPGRRSPEERQNFPKQAEGKDPSVPGAFPARRQGGAPGTGS
jgi:RND family efflux transporter MFP subunit